MTDTPTEAGTLYATENPREFRGLLVPWDEVGKTNLGPLAWARGTIKVPRDTSVLMANVHHDREQVVGSFTSVTDTDRGLEVSVRVADTDEGDTLLASLNEGKLSKLSVEVKNIIRNGTQAISGALFGGAFVDAGAYSSAALYAELAAPSEPVETSETLADEFTDEAGVKHKRTITTTTRTETVDGNTKTTITEKTVIEEPDAVPEEQEGDVSNAVIPETLNASANSAPAALTKAKAFEIMELGRVNRASREQLDALYATTTDTNTLFAALNDVKYNGTGSVTPHANAPQWAGELYSGIAYQQQIVPLFNHADLTQRVISSFRWITKPTGGTWAGNKSDVPSNQPVTEPVTATAKYFAGGHDHAIEHEVFGTPGYFESYYAAMAESYAQWVDETVVLTDIIAASVGSVADNPAGLTIGAGLSAIIDGAAEVVAAKAIPSFALVSPVLWKQIMKTPDNATLGYLSAALGLQEGTLASFTIRPSSLLGANQVLVGSRDAATVYELPGTPIRVQAPDMVRGGIDTNVFGFAAALVHKADALQLVSGYTAA